MTPSGEVRGYAGRSLTAEVRLRRWATAFSRAVARDESPAAPEADKDEILNEYEDPANDPLVLFVGPVLARMPRGRLHTESGVHAGTLERVIAQRQRPHKKTRHRLTQIAVRFARETLESRSIGAPKSDLDTLYSFLDLPWGTPRTCPVCGVAVTKQRATYCSVRCRKQASRSRAKVS